MSLYPLNPASIDEEIKINYKKNNNNNKTLKSREIPNKVSNLNDIMSNIHNNEDDNEEDDANNFINAKNSILNKEEFDKQINQNNLGNSYNDSNNMNTANENNMSLFSDYNNSYNHNNINNNNLVNQEIISNKELLEKLNYMIYLLEEKHNEKTNYIIEELILYIFLGIFIIFVLDSFARAGKYLR